MDETPQRTPRRWLPVLALAAAVLAYFLLNPLDGTNPARTVSPSPTESRTTPPQSTVTPSPQPPPENLAGDALPLLNHDLPDGLIVLSMQENRHAHLFFYHPETLPLMRITSGEWDDIHPALSPDGSRLAFSSNRSGSWDLYVMDLAYGSLTNITDAAGYEASPSWSPDGQFIAYEAITADYPDIYIIQADGSGTPIQLTDDPAADHSPSWSPAGREIAFVSTRTGDAEIWLADLQNTDERFVNASKRPFAADGRPTWTHDGSALAWASAEGGLHHLMIDSMDDDGGAFIAGSGDWPVFSPDGETLLTVLLAPNARYLAAYPTRTRGVVTLPPMVVPGQVHGLTWGNIQLPKPLPAKFSAAAAQTPQPLWKPVVQSKATSPTGRAFLIPLKDINAPDARLLDDVNDAFEALRAFTADEIGWDLLGTLENAYVSITSPLPPGLTNDWLYTGRAFALTSSPIQAGWMVLVREDFGAETYWRVFVKARFQDGSQGRPLKDIPFNLNARYSGDPSVYEKGGELMENIPGGYWIDFTELALRFGWERQPALLTWRTFYQGARFNEFVLSGGLEWHAAMLDLYPVEALISPSPITPVTPSATPTRTPTPTITPSPTQTLAPTQTASPTASDSP